MMLDRLKATRCPSLCHCDLPEEPCPLVWAHTEIERLKFELKGSQTGVTALQETVEHLRDEIKRLRGGLKYVAEHADTKIAAYCQSVLWKPRGGASEGKRAVHDWGYWYVDKRVYDELCAEVEQLRASVKTMVNEREQERKVYNDAIARHLADNEQLQYEIKGHLKAWDIRLAKIERLRDLLAFNGIDPDATIEAAKGAASTLEGK